MVSAGMIVNAGGGGAARSSVWMVKFGPKATQLLFGQNGVMAVDETRVVRLTDASGNVYDGYRKPMLFWAGMHNVNPVNTLVRIRNVTTASGLTDDMLFEGLSLFPSGTKPDAIFMTRRSLRLLRESRTNVNSTWRQGPGMSPEITFATDVDGIPIYDTDNISDAETA
jgi:hypothetical protein